MLNRFEIDMGGGKDLIALGPDRVSQSGIRRLDFVVVEDGEDGTGSEPPVAL
jgi:hypothetical protein